MPVPVWVFQAEFYRVIGTSLRTHGATLAMGGADH